MVAGEDDEKSGDSEGSKASENSNDAKSEKSGEEDSEDSEESVASEPSEPSVDEKSVASVKSTPSQKSVSGISDKSEESLSEASSEHKTAQEVSEDSELSEESERFAAELELEGYEIVTEVDDNVAVVRKGERLFFLFPVEIESTLTFDDQGHVIDEKTRMGKYIIIQMYDGKKLKRVVLSARKPLKRSWR